MPQGEKSLQNFEMIRDEILIYMAAKDKNVIFS